MNAVYSLKDVKKLPEVPGVYTFLGPLNEPLYIGKSKHIKKRIASHFSEYKRTGRRHKLYSQIEAIHIEETAGDISACLLELIRIKEMLPLYNKRSRYAQALIYAHEHINDQGFKTIHLERTSHIDAISSIVSVFRSLYQAKTVLIDYAHEYMLCHKLLGLEKTKGACFSTQLEGCKGACIGKETPTAYNLRVDIAFGSNRVRKWDFERPITITETSRDGTFRDIWTIDNWALQSAYRCVGNHCIERFIEKPKTFDIDMYQIIRHFL